jgi:hypothetical protein
MTTESLYETQMQQFKELDTIGDQLYSQERDMAITVERYAENNLSRTSTNPQILDLIDLSEQMAKNLHAIARLREELQKHLQDGPMTKLDALIMGSKPPEDVTLNENQLELETEHVLNLRNAGFPKVCDFVQQILTLLGTYIICQKLYQLFRTRCSHYEKYENGHRIRRK